jgi:hypothetical protein
VKKTREISSADFIAKILKKNYGADSIEKNLPIFKRNKILFYKTLGIV